MCGIIGYIGGKPAMPILLDGLQRLEYRGYDSAGVAIISENSSLVIKKAVGKLSTLIASLEGRPSTGLVGIGHTRWATHGKPSIGNAHPHTDCHEDIVVIHNGIIENYLPLKRQLQAEGHVFASQTDTEVLPHLIESCMAGGMDLEGAVRYVIGQIKGSHAIVAMSKRCPEKLVAARVGNAGGIVIGYGEGEMFVSSDLTALLPYTRRVAFLSNLEMAALSQDDVTYSTIDGAPICKMPETLAYDPVAVAKGGYKHFMLKEIMEQPQALLDTIRGRAEFESPSVYLEDLHLTPEYAASIKRVVLVGMGTSLYAAMVGKTYIEQLAGLPAEVDNASEFRYREPILSPDTLVISVGQSGETVDTLEAMAEAKRRGTQQVTVCNVAGSQATRIADGVVYIRAGLELGVASTKCFTASVVALYMLALHLGQLRGVISGERMAGLLQDVARLPNLVGRLLEDNPKYEQLAYKFWRNSDFLYLGRWINYPVAMEGALKLKEVSYIHAEGYPAGEMKHGPIALIDENMPVVVIAVRDNLYDKMLSNIEQVKARDGTVIAIATEGDQEIDKRADHVIYVPEVSPFLYPVLNVIPLQLFAYHIAVRRGCDVDQPRNLAKTVTVE